MQQLYSNMPDASCTNVTATFGNAGNKFKHREKGQQTRRRLRYNTSHTQWKELTVTLVQTISFTNFFVSNLNDLNKMELRGLTGKQHDTKHITNTLIIQHPQCLSYMKSIASGAFCYYLPAAAYCPGKSNVDIRLHAKSISTMHCHGIIRVRSKRKRGTYFGMSFERPDGIM